MRDLPVVKRDGHHLRGQRAATSAIERTAVYSSVYHVLGGAFPPMEASAPTSCIASLKRLASDEVPEVVRGANPNVEGTTATYLARLSSRSASPSPVPPAACPSAATSVHR
ncbi:MAG: toprim domain-containing protein [Eggerthellaceae bacterium]